MPAARLGDITAHGGNIVLGCFTVLIGETGGGGGGGGGGGAGAGSSDNAYKGGGPDLAFANFEAQVKTLMEAAKSGTPFCEACFQKALGKLTQDAG